jgi:hypothetical protein
MPARPQAITSQMMHATLPPVCAPRSCRCTFALCRCVALRAVPLRAHAYAMICCARVALCCAHALRKRSVARCAPCRCVHSVLCVHCLGILQRSLPTVPRASSGALALSCACVSCVCTAINIMLVIAIQGPRAVELFFCSIASRITQGSHQTSFNPWRTVGIAPWRAAPSLLRLNKMAARSGPLLLSVLCDIDIGTPSNSLCRRVRQVQQFYTKVRTDIVLFR